MAVGKNLCSTVLEAPAPDRPTRADLVKTWQADFAKIVDRFDGRDVSFVSVTQQFNTTSSMGRLTLNVLLSFAQFEREVTAERIRDKIAASKKKGMWMGGPPPLGYDNKDKKLVVNPTEAKTVRMLFQLYLEYGTVRELHRECQRLGIVTKRRLKKDKALTGGKPFTRGNLYQLLTNPLYIGRVRHKGETFAGQHDAIVDVGTWDAVQAQLDGNAAPRRSNTNAKHPSPLAGLVFDETGDRLCPTHANKNGKRYRYYISQRLMHDADNREGWRIPASEIEDCVIQLIREWLTDDRKRLDALSDLAASPGMILETSRAAAELYDALRTGGRAMHSHILRQIVERIDFKAKSISITLNKSTVRIHLCIGKKTCRMWPIIALQSRRQLNSAAAASGAKITLTSGGAQNSYIDPVLCRLIGNARRWFELLANGQTKSIRNLARGEAVTESDISRVLPLAFLASDIVEAILNGRQPDGMNATFLRHLGKFPADWSEQHRALGI